MCNLTVPVGVKWELLVVNNRCTDDTDSVIARHQMRLPLRRLFEPEPGLSNARNCAVAAAQGDLMLWTDDDVLIDRDWLEAYVAAASKWPDAGYFGGRIEPGTNPHLQSGFNRIFRCCRVYLSFGIWGPLNVPSAWRNSLGGPTWLSA